jgi:hypothetical protein
MRSSTASALVALAFAPGVASAALSDEIQVYDDDINAPREFGLELHANTTPSGRTTPDYPGEVVPAHHFRLTPEFSYGIASAWEAGLYLPGSFDNDGHGSLGGWKVRLKFLPLRGDEGAPGWYAGINTEFSRQAQRFSESRNGLELRNIIGYRAESWLLAVNPVFEWALSPGYRGGPDFSLGVKAVHGVAEKTAVGVEYYSDMGRASKLLPMREQDTSIYAVIDTEIRKTGINFGIGRGITSVADKWTVKAIFAIPF